MAYDEALRRIGDVGGSVVLILGGDEETSATASQEIVAEGGAHLKERRGSRAGLDLEIIRLHPFLEEYK